MNLHERCFQSGKPKWISGHLFFMGSIRALWTPRPELENLASWTKSKRTVEQSIAEAETDRRRLTEADTQFSQFLWIKLNWWPFIVIGALSMKFAKGGAEIRKTYWS